jgi:hypothetical protein
MEINRIVIALSMDLHRIQNAAIVELDKAARATLYTQGVLR